MGMESGITPVMNLGGNNDLGGLGGFGGIIGLLAVLGIISNGGSLFGNNNNGNDALLAAALANNNGFSNAIGYENLATSNEVQRGFDNQNAMANQREILAAVNAQGAAGIAATNQTFHDTLMADQNLYNELSRDIAALGVGQANMLANQNQCCCSIKQMVMQNNYDGALRDAATNANFTAQIQGLKDMIQQDKIERLQNQVNQLNLQNQLAGVVRYPQNVMYAVPSPCFGGGCSCGC